MKIQFEYIKDLPPPRLGDGLTDFESPLFEKIKGEGELEEFLELISKEEIIRNLKIEVLNG